MEFFRIKRDIPFMRHALTFNVISLVTFLLAVFFLATKGLNFGVDFRGGTVIEVAYNHAVDFNRLRGALDKLSLGEYSAQAFGRSDTALIRMPLKEGVSTAQLSEQVMSTLRSDDPSVTLKRVEFVGPQVGKELCENGALALLLVIAGVFLFMLGSGPIRGFAVVHCLGILTSMFSAVFVSRGIVAIIYGSRKKLDRISIGQVWKPGGGTPPPAPTKA
jgi:preprotein translocase subunit SecF